MSYAIVEESKSLGDSFGFIATGIILWALTLFLEAFKTWKNGGSSDDAIFFRKLMDQDYGEGRHRLHEQRRLYTDIIEPNIKNVPLLRSNSSDEDSKVGLVNFLKKFSASSYEKDKSGSFRPVSLMSKDEKYIFIPENDGAKNYRPVPILTKRRYRASPSIDDVKERAVIIYGIWKSDDDPKDENDTEESVHRSFSKRETAGWPGIKGYLIIAGLIASSAVLLSEVLTLNIIQNNRRIDKRTSLFLDDNDNEFIDYGENDILYLYENDVLGESKKDYDRRQLLRNKIKDYYYDTTKKSSVDYDNYDYSDVGNLDFTDKRLPSKSVWINDISFSKNKNRRNDELVNNKLLKQVFSAAWILWVFADPTLRNHAASLIG